ncbi:MAG: hypothetical protein Q8N01_10345 [Sulfuricurvum sp.]|nr:hypothetical protein [Sulfuricurvum sp.]MDP3022321.1 hypothetical protein [Sulfuricurvum sp.]MDP3120805.1 hypothetical protein [Sulfuricurvum sp.]
MKILLLNDNPVVRKLVALSAQKTKDELSVIWSVDEVEGDSYDLLIVDDAHYSDESMAALRDKIQYKTSLLMATRGNSTPSGFEKVINKPFLPTDLVDLFSQIDKDLSSSAPKAAEEKGKAIVLDDVIEKELAENENFDTINIDEDLNFDDFDIDVEDEIEAAVKTNVLDHEEVQELQDLLDDTDNFDIDDEITDTNHIVSNDDLLESLDDDILQTLETENSIVNAENDLQEVMEEFDFDEELFAQEEEPVKAIEEAFEDEDLLGSLDEEFAELAEVSDGEDTAADETETTVDEALDDLDALLLDDLGMMDDEELSALESTHDALSDDEFGELEQQIQEAVEELGFEDLEQGLDEIEMEELSSFEGLADLDSLSERDIKLAIGEEVEEVETDTEMLSEAIEESSMLELEDELENIDTELIKGSEEELHHGTPAEGIDALQALLKALSNEEVSKTLKGLSINININFGNEK